jgi:DNA-binding NarL/FixJ family response regulator
MQVIIAEDAGLYRDLLCQTLVGNGIDVVGLAATADEVVALADACPADLVLLDIRMPPTFTDDGLRAAVRIRAHHPELAILVLSNYGEVEYAVRLVEEIGGSVGYLLKERTASSADLLDAIDRVCRGGMLIDPEVVARLIKRSRDASPLRLLTPRELEALALMAEGHSNAAVARRMRIAASTLEKHVTAVFRKLALGEEVTAENARVRAVLTYLRSTGRMTEAEPEAVEPGAAG